jgi:hypothetical protein
MTTAEGSVQATRIDDLEVVRTPPTHADAQLITQLMMVDAATGAMDGYGILDEFDSPPTLAQLRRKHPKGSTEYRHVQAFLMSCEALGTFVRQGILNEALVHDLFWVGGAWRMAEKIAKGERKEAGEPRIFENFEWLAGREAGTR